ncbi:hypothetical protein [Streptomyces rochei]|uniref:hypothetical protein n=1 Tax=Streptomyces rochei TaxID=1928 RepID=UPI0036FE80B6
MNTKRVNGAAGVILAALTQNRTPAGIALALESAGLLMTPETAEDMASTATEAVRVAEESVTELRREHAENARLRAELEKFVAIAYQEMVRAAHFSEAARLLEAAGYDDDAVNFLDNMADGIRTHAAAEGVNGSVDKLTRLLAPTQALRAAEDIVHPCGCPKRFDRHAWGCPTLPEPGACCDLHKVSECCDPEDCGPCCEQCPTCPTLARQRTSETQKPRGGLTADEFNDRYPVGTPVIAYPDTREDPPLLTCTRSRAWELGHGLPVVMVDGYSGGICLTHVDSDPNRSPL